MSNAPMAPCVNEAEFCKSDKFVNKKWKGVKSEKIKVFPLVCSKYLSSWTGPDMSKSRLLV